MESKNSYKVFWTETAERDLEEIIDYIALDSVDVAIKIFLKLKTKAESLNIFPKRGRVVPELRENDIFSYRELIINPWRIIYRISGEKVFVLAVLDGRRDLSSILLERLVR